MGVEQEKVGVTQASRTSKGLLVGVAHGGGVRIYV